jgi:hypothetical protein
MEFMDRIRRRAQERRIEAWLENRRYCFAQHDMDLANQAGAGYRSDNNNALQALATISSGATAPATMFAYMLWADTTSGLLKQRNAANNGWLVRSTLAETFVIDRASNTILASGDFARTFRATAGFTQTLTAAATLGDGWLCYYRVESGATITFDPNGSENIDSATTKSVVGPSSGVIFCNGSAFFTVSFTGTGTVNAASLTGSAIGFVGMINGTIVTSRAANAETIAIKTLAGVDPSASDPVIFVFRNATAGNGDYVFLAATAALSITISSGSTMGATNSVLFRLWLTVFNDGSTLRLGVVNCLSGTSIMALKDDDLLSSTAEGGAGGADSAQVIYTGTAVTNKALRVLGYLEYTLAAVGTWNAAPTKIQLFGPGVPLANQVVQTRIVKTGTVATGTTQIPADDTIPTNAEGTAWGAMDNIITPTSAANILSCTISTECANSSSGANLQLALYQDSSAAIAATRTRSTAVNAEATITMFYSKLAGATSATTFKVRFGPDGTGGTMTVLGTNGNGAYGGVCPAIHQIEEIMA